MLYLSLFIALTLRYASFPSQELWNVHKWPFFFIYLGWLLIFYMAGLYDIEKIISYADLRILVFKTMAVCGTLAILLFYLTPFFSITPKTNLILDVLISSFLIWLWRKVIFNEAIKSSKIRVFFFGKEIKEIADFVDFLSRRPQLGFEISDYAGSANVIVAPMDSKYDKKIARSLYEMTLLGKTIMSFDKFYESITGKIPVSLINEEWFFDNLTEIEKQNFEKIKRVIDLLLAFLLFVPYVAMFPLIATAIKINGKGFIFYRQKRVGKNGKIFKITKFRSMIENAEKNGAEWTKPEREDQRVTFVGNILRKTRIDELPQIWSVIKGDLSFVGPRPERPKFVKELEQKISYYAVRHLVKPGLTGWAQINFSEAAAKDAPQKLQYDLYYIKNRSLSLEISIMLKTIAVIFRSEGK